MTTTDTFSGPSGAPTSGQRSLRRSRTNRVAAGVCSGLGDYFGFDPVLFRVLFATAAFFGGAGIVAYLLAWAAIPEAGTEHAPIDGFIAWVRRRRVPMLLAVLLGVLFLWAVAFSWWAPHPFFPVIAVVILIIVLFARRELQSGPPTPPPPAPGTTSPVDLTKGAAPAPQDDQPTWVRDARSWFDEARAASRERRRRSLPIRIAVTAALAVALTVLGIADAVRGVEFQWYFWTTLAIVGVGLLAGMATRRTPWGLTALLIPAVAGAVAFAGSDASLHDGIGQREWRPTTTAASSYRLMFGQGILDLRDLAAGAPQHIGVTMGSGQVKVIALRSQNVTVHANIHIGQLEVDRREVAHTGHGGVNVSRTVAPPPGATGTPIIVDVHLANGNITVDRRP